ncbi:MAG: spore germination protein GerW family protein [Oscillospiraceae bacterium]|nr:spore germination protein GerW family protein [Oscillospiraceae bacterium]
MAEQHPINEMLETAMEKIREMANSGTVIGDPVVMPNGVTAIPVCKVTFGFASGGIDLAKQTPDKFGGGTGGGVSITPVAFLVTTKESVKLMQLDTIASTADNIVRTVPEVIDKVSALISGRKSEE